MPTSELWNRGRGVVSALMAEVCMEDGVVQLEPRVARIEADVASLKDSVARLDQKVDRLDERVDERFNKVDDRFDKVDDRFDKVDEKFAKIDEKFAMLDGKVNTLDKRMAVFECGLEGLRENQARFHDDLNGLRGSLDAKFIWIVTTMITFGIALLAAMAKGFHWLQ